MRAAFVVVMVIATSASAQSLTTGAIRGVVTDKATGEPLVGATVTATAAGRTDQQSAITESDGSYKVTDLLPGTYDVSFLYDTAKALQNGVQVEVDRTTSLYQKLDLKGPPIIRVYGTRPPLDTTSPAHGLHIGRRELEDLPVPGPTFVSALGSVGGSQNDGFGISFSGSTSLENRYIVDGIDITGLTFGDVGNPILNEFIQDIEVVTGGYNAEHGRSTGGIVNIVTRSGTDTLHGSVFGVLTPGFLTAATHSTPVQASSIDVTPNQAYTGHLGFELGGPLIKGRAWFYLGVAPQVSRTDYTRTTKRQTDCRKLLDDGKLSGCDPANADTHPDVDPKTGFYITDPIDTEIREGSTRSTSVIAKLNAAVTPDNQAALSLIALPASSETPGLVGLRTSGRKTSSLTTDSAARWTAKLNDDHTEIEALIAWHRSTLDSGSIDPTLDGKPLQILEDGNLATWSALGGESAKTIAACTDNGPNDPYPLITNCPMRSQTYVTGGPGGINHDLEDRRTARLSVIERLRALGSHEIKAGVDFEDDAKSLARLMSGGAVITNDIGGHLVQLQRWAQLAAPGAMDPAYDETCHDSGGSAIGATTPTYACRFLTGVQGSPGTQIDGQTINWAAYLRDSWQPITNLTFDGGVRYEEQRLRYAESLRGTTDPLTGEHIGTNAMTLTGNIAPRVGIVYDPTSEGNAKLYANWGRFYESIPMDINDRSFGGEVSDLRTFTGENICGPTVPSLGGQDGNGCLHNAMPSTEQLIGASGVLVAPGIKAEYLDEILVGAEAQLVPNLVAGVLWQHRRLGRVIEDVSTDGAQTYIIANPGEWSAGDEHDLETKIAGTADPTERARLTHELDLFRGIRVFDKPVRDYDSIELSLGRRFAPGLYLQSTYTYSRTEGNYPGSVSYDNGQVDPNISSQYDLIELLANRRGLLPQDRPHSFKVDATYGIDLGDDSKLTLGTRVRAISGIPINALGAHYLYGPNESFLLPRGAMGRTELEHGVDIHVGYRRKLSKSTAGEVYVDVFNVYNSQGAFNVDNTYAPAFRSSAPGTTGGTANNVNPISGGSYSDLIWAKAIDQNGNETSMPTARNPNFGQPISRYAPTSAQIGFRLVF